MDPTQNENDNEQPRVDTDMRSLRPFNAPPTPRSSVSSAVTPPHARQRQGRSSTGSGPGSDSWPLSPDTEDRVFPIRSVVSVEPKAARPQSPYPWSPGNSIDGMLAGGPPSDTQSRASSSTGRRLSVNSMGTNSAGSEYGSTRSGSVAVDDQSERAESEPPGEEESTGDPREMFMTSRHKHVDTADGHMIVTGIDGSEKIQRCEHEPIHIPGAIQAFGCLVALKEVEEGILDVRIASENTEDILGYSPSALFDLENFCRVLSDEQAESLFDHIEFIREDTSDPRLNGPEVFSLTATNPKAVEVKLWCAVHVPEQNPDLIVCEFELEDDQIYPLMTSSEVNTPEPEDTLSSNPTEEELAESTLSMSKPLRVLRHARRRKGEAAAMEVFNLMSQIQEQLASATNLEVFLKVVVGVVKELTGFHRVMMYQFDEAWNGQVVTELVDPKATKDLYKGLHFPASDIPAQARELYKINKVRLLYDRELATARFVCRSKDDLETPLDLTHSYLRAMSPAHLKYLGNMAVRATMSISITAFDQLWGLISCHSYGFKGSRVSFPIRKMCRLIGETASRNIERLSYAKRLHARKLINTVPTEQNPGGYIVASSDDLLKLFDADFGMLNIRDETKVLGKLENSQEALAMLEYLKLRNFATVMPSQDLAKDFPDLHYAPGFQLIAGLLLVPLSINGGDFIVFFRKGQLRHVHWAGNPYEKVLKRGTDSYLEPRKSFKIWSEVVVGKSREWSEEQVETAAVLCLVYGKFIEVWRQKEAALKTSQLTKLLLANASHEVRTPLNAIINYLEIALEGPLDGETRDNLSRSHSASKSLIYVINDLLDLTRMEGGNDLVKDEEFDLSETLGCAVEMYKADCLRKNVTFDVIEHPGLPTTVIGDSGRLRQIISNICGNAVKNTVKGSIKVELWTSNVHENGQGCDVDIEVLDTGVGISPSKKDMLFREFEQVHTEDDIETPPADFVPEEGAMSRIPGKKILGLGLAVVARSIRNMKGQLRLSSEEGKGSRFTVSLPFALPENQSPSTDEHRNSPMPMSEGEMTLVGRPPLETMRRNSGGSIKSSKSVVSAASANTQRSEIDRLVDAISSPHLKDGPGYPDGHGRSHSADAATTSSAPFFQHAEALSRSSSTGASTSSATITAASSAGRSSTTPGQKVIEDSATPLKSIRIANGGVDVPAHRRAQEKAALRGTSEQAIETVLSRNLPGQEAKVTDYEQKPRVLVAEDDPVNSKIMAKRLERMGYSVLLTPNGEECYSSFCEDPDYWDAILMDMQMPIMDGGTATTRIRMREAKFNDPNHTTPAKHARNGRVPIFAVSASLLEDRRKTYMDLGFDGWILKPVDFKRLDVLLSGRYDTDARKDSAYKPGEWERGGWFWAEESGTEEKRDEITAAGVRTEVMAV